MICPDKIMECWESCNEVQLADAKNYYTKAQVDEKIDEIEVSGITEEKAEEMIDNALEDYYSRGETDDLIGGLEEVDAAISGAVESLDETVDDIGDRVHTLYLELGERAVTSSFAADVQSDYIDLQFTYKSGWGEDEDSETKYVELPSATTQKAGVMSAEDKTKLDNTYTKTEVDETLEGYATKDWVSGYTYDKQTIEDMIEEGGGFIPENYYTKTDVDGLVSDLEAADSVISGAVDNVSSGLTTEAQRAQNAESQLNSKIETISGESVSSGEVQTMIASAVSGKADTTAVTQVNNTLTAHTADTNVHVTANEKSSWNNKSDFSGDYNDLTNKPTIPVVPTNVSDFTNDAGYITIDAISGKADTSAVTQAISAAVSGKADSNNVYTKTEVDTALNQKQNTLTAGSGITISNNTISAKIWSGTQAQYEALVNKDSDTIYLIYNE